MRLTLSLLAFSAAFGARVSAGEPWPLFDGQRWHYPKLCEERRQRDSWCPNDYCRKPLPVFYPNLKGDKDDYCRKSMPIVMPNAKGHADDYCPKSGPLLLGPLCEPWYSCGTPGPSTSRK